MKEEKLSFQVFQLAMGRSGVIELHKRSVYAYTLPHTHTNTQLVTSVFKFQKLLKVRAQIKRTGKNQQQRGK